MFRRSFPFVLFVVACFPISSRAAAPDPAVVDALFADALKSYPVPGFAVAIVHNDEVVYLKGHGVREAGGKDAVTPDTLFGIGSCSKAFVATTLGLLVDDGKVSWDDSVRKHVPYFHLKDALADRDVTLRDLLCHRTGLSRHDMLWYRAPWSVEETVRRMAHIQPNTSFRSTYEYNNLCYLTAGLAIEGAAKSPWQDVVQKRLFDKLDMKGAVFTRAAVLKAPDHATPHQVRDGKPQVISWYPDDNQIRASGAIKAGVRDMSHWMRMQLNEGVYDGKRVVPARILAETHSAQMVVPSSTLPRMAESNHHTYGLGWHLYDYRGHLVWDHGGAVDGFRTKLVLLPKQKIGLLVVANADLTEVVQATSYELLDHVLGLEKRDWKGHYSTAIKQGATAASNRKEAFDAGRKKDAKASRELDAYVGTYEEPAYGKLKITKKAGGLQLSWSSFEGRIELYRDDTFAFAEPGRVENELATFALGADRSVTAVRFLGRTFRRVK